MHRRRNHALILEQQQLVLRNAELRATLAHQSQALKPPLALADRLRSGLLWLDQYSIGRMIALALLALNRPRRTMRGLSRLFVVSQLLLRTWHWIGGIRARRDAH